MTLLWDEPKRLANLEKHHLDFRDFPFGFDFSRVLSLPARPSRTGRVRYKLVGPMGGKLIVAAIVSPLGSEVLSLVSLRLANPKERKAYAESQS